MANVMPIHCELFTDVSTVEGHGIGLHNRQMTLWPKSLCQSRTIVATKCHQGQENAISIHDQRSISIHNTFGDVFLIQLFSIRNESGYVFDDFRPIFHGVGFARLWISIQKQTFSILVLMPHEYTILRTPIRRCAHKLELHGRDTIIPRIKAELLCFRMSHQTFHSFQHVWLNEGLEIWYFLNHVWDDRHIVKSMYDFMRSGLVGKSSSCNIMLQRPNDASILLFMCPTINKDTNTSLNMPFATSNDKI